MTMPSVQPMTTCVFTHSQHLVVMLSAFPHLEPALIVVRRWVDRTAPSAVEDAPAVVVCRIPRGSLPGGRAGTDEPRKAPVVSCCRLGVFESNPMPHGEVGTHER
jgi:hypothetical protein